jgi:hypothetical protein
MYAVAGRTVMRSLANTVVLGSLVLLAGAALAAVASAQTKYGGIGATTSAFDAENPQRAGRPPVGVVDYRINDERDGRVAGYQVVVNPRSKLTRADLIGLLRRELPADAKQVQGWKRALDPGSYCAIYRSSWLGRVLYGPYVVLYASPATQEASAMVSTAPACRG